MSQIQKARVSSSNPEELAGALSRVYCPHTTIYRRSNSALPAMLEIQHVGAQPVVELRYGVPVKVDAGQSRRQQLPLPDYLGLESLARFRIRSGSER